MGKSKYDLGGLLKELEKSDSSSSSEREYSNDFWKPTLEKGEERAEYVIRFLPNPDSKTNFPWVERAAHMFNFSNSGKFIYKACAKKARGEKCFICEEVSRLYQSGDPAQEAIGAKRYSKKRYFHNVLIVKDPRDNGKNEGKVMIYEAGQQIHEKCVEFLKNEDLDASERIYFHPEVGTDFKLILTWKSNYQNYEKSDFARKTSPLEVDGKELELDEAEKFIEENCHKLNELILADKNFTEYEKLKEIYLNEGVVDEKPKSKKVDVEEDAGEEVYSKSEEEDEDTTVDDRKIESSNPKSKSKVEVEKNEDPPFDTDDEEMDDEDAELAALLEG
jgi:hypothetical protein